MSNIPTIAPFEIILFCSEGEFSHNLLYDTQEELNTGEHGNVDDPTTRCDWNGKKRRFEVLINAVTGTLNLTVRTNQLEEAVKLRTAAADAFNRRYEIKRKAAMAAREAGTSTSSTSSETP